MPSIDIVMSVGKQIQKIVIFSNMLKAKGGGYDSAPPFLLNPLQIVSSGKPVPELLGFIGIKN